MSEEKAKKGGANKPESELSKQESKKVSRKSEDIEAKTKETEKLGFDPFAQMFQFYDSFAKSWSSVMTDAVSSKGFAESMGQQMESNLDAMKLVRSQMGDLMEQYLQQMSLPTRKEVISIAKRLTHLEMALDDLDAKMDEVLELLKTISHE